MPVWRSCLLVFTILICSPKARAQLYRFRKQYGGTLLTQGTDTVRLTNYEKKKRTVKTGDRTYIFQRVGNEIKVKDESGTELAAVVDEGLAYNDVTLADGTRYDFEMTDNNNWVYKTDNQEVYRTGMLKVEGRRMLKVPEIESDLKILQIVSVETGARMLQKRSRTSSYLLFATLMLASYQFSRSAL